MANHIQNWAFYLNVPMTLSDGSISDKEFNALIEKSMMGNDTIGSYIELTRNDITELFKQSIQ